MQIEPCALAFVSGSDEEKEKQISEIRAYCKNEIYTPPSDSGIFSDWDTMVKKLKDDDTKDKFTIFIADLSVLSRELCEFAERLYVILVNLRIRVEVVNKEHFDLLEKYQPDRLTKDQLELIKPRLLGKFGVFEELGQQILEPK